MEYTISKLAEISGVSTRTLRYYDEINLLKPKRVNSNGYRIYGQVEVDTLQQILFFRELGLPLENIGVIILSPTFDREKTLIDHLDTLLQRKEQIENLIDNVSKTISSVKGEKVMQNNEKFNGLKKAIIQENTQKYGNEVISKYGDEVFTASNAKVAEMTQEQWDNQQSISSKIIDLLKLAIQVNDPSCENAQKACDLHRQWISMFWKTGSYSKATHKSLAEMYVTDERFTAFYDEKLGDGGTEFLRDAILIYTK